MLQELPKLPSHLWGTGLLVKTHLAVAYISAQLSLGMKGVNLCESCFWVVVLITECSACLRLNPTFPPNTDVIFFCKVTCLKLM